MKVASLTSAKNDLSRLVEQVRRGERVRILVRGRPAADLVPVGTGSGSEDAPEDEAEMVDLERRGIVTRGAGGVAPEIGRPGPRLKTGSAVQAVLSERRRGR